MTVDDKAGLPQKIMTFLINNQVVSNMNDLHLITVDDSKDLRSDYEQVHDESDPEEKKIWSFLGSSCQRSLIEWFNSYHQAFGQKPELGDLTHESFLMLPEELIGSMGSPEIRERFTFYMSPDQRNNNITSHRPYCSFLTQGSQAMKRRNVKVSMTEYPKISGKAKDWIVFESKFRSVASSQGFDHVLQDKDYEPSACIYDAFENARADSTWLNK